jgi:hypothetical protein
MGVALTDMPTNLTATPVAAGMNGFKKLNPRRRLQELDLSWTAIADSEVQISSPRFFLIPKSWVEYDLHS